MTTAATSLLGLALPVTGELSGTWGDTVNNSITSLLDSAVAGTTTLSTDADVTLTTTTLAANQAREAIILWTAAGTVTRTITAPAQSKTYVVINSSSTQSIKLVGAGPTAGITVLPGESTYAAWNGSDFVKVGEYGGNLTVNSLTTTASTTGSTNKGPLNYGTLNFSDTGIVQSAQTSVNSYFQNVIQNTSAGTAASAEFIAYNDQGTASTNYATVGINSSGYTGTGSINAAGYAYFLSASTDLVLGTIGANGIHFTTNSSATDALAISSAGAVSLPGGTANGVAYLNGSKVVTTGSALTFDGTNLGLGVTPSAWSYRSLSVGTAGTSIWQTGSDFGLSSNAYNNSGWKYNITGGASLYDLSGNQHIWSIAPSGTAGNAITFTQAMTLDASGNLLVGTTSAIGKLTVNGVANVNTIQTSGSPAGSFSASKWFTQTEDTVNSRTYICGPNSSTYGNWNIYLATSTGSPVSALNFAPSATIFGIPTTGSEAARIDSSGNLLVGSTSVVANANNFVYSPGNAWGIFGHVSGTASGIDFTKFYYNGAQIGSISQSGTTAVLYNLTSDQRLKTNIVDAAPASALIDAIQVRQYDWKSDGSHQRYGFIAQELVTVAPEAVHQPADPEEMMAVDYSKLVPMLVKEIQDLRKRLAAAGI